MSTKKSTKSAKSTKRPLLEIRSLDLSYPGNGAGRPVRHSVLRQISLFVETGESFGMVGESGSGKSTVANVLRVKLLEMGDRFDGQFDRVAVEGK